MQSDPLEKHLNILIACELELEARPIIRLIERRRLTTASGFRLFQGTLSGRQVALVRGCAGTKLAQAVEAVIYVHRPRWLLSAGCAAGLAEPIRSGDLVAAEEIRSGGGTSVRADVAPFHTVFQRHAVHVGRLVSLPRLPRSRVARSELGKNLEVLAADIHSSSLALLGAAHGCKFLSLRVVTCDTTQDTPPESQVVYHPSKSFRMGGMLGAFLGGSGRVSKIMRARGQAKSFAERLAKLVAQVVHSCGSDEQQC
jgi:nucleoside phosphorylase